MKTEAGYIYRLPIALTVKPISDKHGTLSEDVTPMKVRCPRFHHALMVANSDILSLQLKTLSTRLRSISKCLTVPQRLQPQNRR